MTALIYPTSIEAITDIRLLIRQGFNDWKLYGDVNANYSDDLVIFNYNQNAQFANRWNWFERVSRGLVFNASTGKLLARPFKKFFNYGERFPDKNAHLIDVSEKCDGSLGILFRHNNKWRITTRGSLTSDQGKWATEFFNMTYKTFPIDEFTTEHTFLFEIIYPENKIVVDYGKFEGLVLLAVIKTDNGQEYQRPFVRQIAKKYGFSQPMVYEGKTLQGYLDESKTLSSQEEGFILYYSDGSRFKIKGDAYIAAHNAITNLTFKRVLEVVERGNYEDFIKAMPPEYMEQIQQWKQEIDTVVNNAINKYTQIFESLPIMTRKDFALYVKTNYKRHEQNYLFSLLDGRDITKAVYKCEFENVAEGE